MQSLLTTLIIISLIGIVVIVVAILFYSRYLTGQTNLLALNAAIEAARAGEHERNYGSAVAKGLGNRRVF